MTDLGQLPADWDVVEVGSLCKVHGRIGFRGYTADDLVPAGQGALAIGGKHITHCVLDLSSPDYISWEKYYESPEIMVKKGDIVVAQRGTLGKAAIVDREIGPATINPSLVLLNNIRCNPYYLYYYLISEPVTSKILSQSGLTSIPMISQKQVEGIKIAIPHTSEQNRIAEALWKMNALISSLDRIILKKRMIKQGTMQNLLTGKIRLKGFSQPWEEYRLDDLVTIFKGFGLSKEKLSNNGPFPCLLYGEIFTTYDTVVDNCASHTCFNEGIPSKTGDILMPGSTTTCGIDLAKAICVLHDDILLGGDVVVLRKRDYATYNSYFLAAVLTNIKKREIEQITQGITIIHLNTRVLPNITISLPKDVNEQFKIASILSAMDSEISSLEAERDKYKNIKQGMMQKLLTGQIRLPV